MICGLILKMLMLLMLWFGQRCLLFLGLLHMAKVTGIGLVSGIDLYTVDSTPNHQIGQIVWDGNAGKAFRYALVGASNLVMGNLLQGAVRDTQFENVLQTLLMLQILLCVLYLPCGLFQVLHWPFPLICRP